MIARVLWCLIAHKHRHYEHAASPSLKCSNPDCGLYIRIGPSADARRHRKPR